MVTTIEDLKLPCRVPPGLLATIDRLNGRTAKVSYSRSYDIDTKTWTPKRPAVWETREPDEADPRKRVKVGEGDPVLVDVVMIKIEGTDDDIVRMAGQWIDAKPDSFVLMVRGDGENEEGENWRVAPVFTNYTDWLTYL